MTKRDAAKRILRKMRMMRSALIVLFLVLSASAFAQSTPFPMLEDYLPSGKVAQYIDAASKYLQQYPTSRFAPRVAFDLIMVSEGTSNKTLADRMRAVLLFEHARSLQAFYVVSGFKEAKDLRDFLKNQAKIKFKDSPESLSLQFTQAVEVGLDHFKEKLLEDGGFLLQAYALADIVGAERISKIILPTLRRECAADEDLSFVFDILQDNALKPVEKIIKLHGRNKDTDFLEQFYLTTLTPAQKMHPPILKINAENAIRSKEYETAQIAIGSMPNDMQNDPQIRFWKGWSLFALRKDQQAIDTFDQLIKIHPNNKWAIPANIFSQGIQNYAQWQQLNAKAILAATKVFQQGVGVLEATFSYNQKTKNGPKQTYRVYVGVVPDENYLEFSIFKADRLFLGYKTTATDSALYLEGEPKILTFRERGLIPTPNLALDRDSDGTFVFQAGVEMASSIKQAAAGSSGLFKSPYLSTPEGIQNLLDYVARRKGWIAALPLALNGTHMFVWKIPETDIPALKQVEFHISRHHLITSAKFEHWSIQDLRYAPTKSFRLKPPPWPDHPVAIKQEFDFSAWVKVFSSAMGVFIEKP